MTRSLRNPDPFRGSATPSLILAIILLLPSMIPRASAAEDPTAPSRGGSAGQEGPASRPEEDPPASEKVDEPALEELQRIIEEQRRKLEEQDELAVQQRKEIEAMRSRLEEMQKQLEAQGELTEAQRRQIEGMNELLLSVQNRINEMKDQPPDDSVSDALQKRLDALEATLKDQPEVSAEVITAGDFPGSIRVPGTDAAIRFGGRVHFSTVWNLDALGVDDRFVTAKIPIRGTEAAGEESRLTMNSRASRFNFDLRTPTGVGYMRAYVEGDFAEENDSFRLRHAFGQYKRLIVGKTWSTFSDPQAAPNSIDFEGLNSRVLVRQPLIRFTQELSEDKTFAFGIEDPDAEITNGDGVNLFPDVIARFRWEKPYGPLGHLQTAVLFRQVRAESEMRPQKVERQMGFGATLSGMLAMPAWHEKDNMVFQITGGEGIGSYLNDLDSEGGQDAVFDVTGNRMKLLRCFGIYTAYQHWWRDDLYSNLLYGFVIIDNRGIQSGDSYEKTHRWSLNLIWNPIPRIDVGVEYFFGTRENKDGGRGNAEQLQMAVIFNF